MKIRMPHYYKDFKCIAGACTDTCCAGWDVDVDQKSYDYYKTVKGEFGKRLKKVMVPQEYGGCTFTLNNNRCPFLNDKNLCDLYTELGEDKLCDTCDEFPRFINIYGNVKEIGIAPSCITAGELIFNCKEKLTFDIEDDGKTVSEYNDIDAYLYMQLLRAREIAYEIVQNEKFTVDESCLLLIDYAVKIQKHIDDENDHLIENVVYAYMEEDYLRHRLSKINEEPLRNGGYSAISGFFAEFSGMEVINKDWYKCLEVQRDFMSACTESDFKSYYREFDNYYRDRQFEYRQLLMYYVYRYFLDAVYDYKLVLKVKNAVVGYIVLKHLDVAKWYKNEGHLSKEEQIDMAHLYSRQFEHSYTNYEAYRDMFIKKRIYSISSLKRLLRS